MQFNIHGLLKDIIQRNLIITDEWILGKNQRQTNDRIIFPRRQSKFISAPARPWSSKSEADVLSHMNVTQTEKSRKNNYFTYLHLILIKSKSFFLQNTTRKASGRQWCEQSLVASPRNLSVDATVRLMSLNLTARTAAYDIQLIWKKFSNRALTMAGEIRVPK